MDAHDIDAMSAPHGGPVRDATSDDDLSLDRALQQMLSVQPSPEFAARVRMAVREEQPARRSSPWWAFAGGAAIAAAVLVAALAWTIGMIQTPAPAADASVPQTVPPDTARRPAAAESVEPPSRAEKREGRAAADGDRKPVPAPANARLRRPSRPSPSPVPREPEVLIAPEEQAGWRLLVEAATSRPMVGLDVASPTLDLLPVPADLTLPALTVEPIVVTQ